MSMVGLWWLCEVIRGGVRVFNAPGLDSLKYKKCLSHIVIVIECSEISVHCLHLAIVFCM